MTPAAQAMHFYIKGGGPQGRGGCVDEGGWGGVLMVGTQAMVLHNRQFKYPPGDRFLPSLRHAKEV